MGDHVAGALAPAGEGRLRLWPDEASSSAKALLDGQRPAELKLVLYDSPDKAIEKQQARTPLQVVQAGGLIAWVIVVLGFVGLALVLLRAFGLWRAGGNTRPLMQRLEALVARGELTHAAAFCAKHGGAAPRVLHRMLLALKGEHGNLEDQLSEAMLQEVPRIERFGSAILAVAAVAPLLGLLGTVTGMISTFEVITIHGTGNPKLLSGGISEALITTELGLVVAIPTLLVGTLLAGWGQRIVATIEHAALRLLNVGTGNAEPAGQIGQALDEPNERTPQLAPEAT